MSYRQLSFATFQQCFTGLFAACLILSIAGNADAQFPSFGGSFPKSIRGVMSSPVGSSFSPRRRGNIDSVAPPAQSILPVRPSLGQQVGQAVVSAAMNSIQRPATSPRRPGVVAPPAKCVRPAPAPIVYPTSPRYETPGHIVVHTPVTSADTVYAGRPQPSPSVEEQQLIRLRELVSEAKTNFRAGEYNTCVEKINLAMELSTEDADLLQFRAFAFFAANDIDSAAADIYDALMIGETWNWDAVRDLYQSKPLYEMHLRRLEQRRREEPSMVTHFTLAYQYLTLKHLERGQKELRRALEFQPDEPLMTQLVSVVDQVIDQK